MTILESMQAVPPSTRYNHAMKNEAKSIVSQKVKATILVLTSPEKDDNSVTIWDTSPSAAEE